MRTPRASLPGLLAGALAAAAACPAQQRADFAQRLQHWAWQPLQSATPVADAATDPIDAILDAELSGRGLPRAEPAPPEAWLRRVHFDLTGLPPAPETTSEFLAAPSRQAQARVVDRLLAAPAFGERWARHWLDLVRYAETMGHEFDFAIPGAWRYRDYVIRALNDDVPFRDFAIEHIAGDLLQEPRLHPTTGTNESALATGFYWFCEQTHSPVDAMQHQADRIDNQIDVLTKTFLGMTVACARCHDHKFDAIGSDDYYALYGFLKSSRYVQRPLCAVDRVELQAAQDAQLGLAALAGAAPSAAALDPSLDGWTAVGDGDRPHALRSPFVVDVQQDRVELLALPGSWLATVDASRGREAVLMSPTFVPEQPYLHLEVAGQGARLLLVVDGFHLVRDPIYGRLRKGIDDPRPHWVTIDLGQFRGRRAHLQLLDQAAHDLADPARDRRRHPADAWLAIRRVVPSDRATPPEPAPASTRSTLLRSDPAVEAALLRWQAACAALPTPASAPGMADGTGEDERVFLRGDHRTRAEVAPRRFLRAIAGDAPMALEAGSGRLELARRMFQDDNPLPPRVLANRIWSKLFGDGLCRTVDNLGHLGDEPVQRALLDHLARSLQQEGWSQKRLIRRIVLTDAYGRDSTMAPSLREQDPDNRFLGRQNLRRLEGEAIRDAMLAVAGRLDARLYGPPVPVRLPPDERARGKPEHDGPLDGDGRRSVYLAVPRNFLPEFLVAFDQPRPASTIGRRTTANVPAQGLALQNDPFVRSMADRCADLLSQDGPIDAAAAVERWFVSMFARRPEPQETALCLAFVADADAAAPQATWAGLAHALFNKKEFVFLR